MRYLALILLLAVIGCNQPIKVEKYPVFVHGTITVHDTVKLAGKTDTVRIVVHERIQNNCDKVKSELFTANYKIERVKYYLRIVERNPSQAKFLRGWVKRVIE